jgi:hypothetical protein
VFATDETLNNALERREQSWLRCQTAMVDLRFRNGIAGTVFWIETDNRRSQIGNP